MNKLLLITLSIFLIAFTSANFYCGDSGTLDFPNDKPFNVTYELNDSIMDWFNWYKNGTTIYWSIDNECEPEEFRVIFYNEEYKQTFSSSGGSSSSRNKVKDNLNDSLIFIVNKTNVNEESNDLNESINESETNDYNKKDLGWKKWLLIIPFLVFIVIVIIVIYRKRNLKKEEDLK